MVERVFLTSRFFGQFYKHLGLTPHDVAGRMNKTTTNCRYEDDAIGRGDCIIIEATSRLFQYVNQRRDKLYLLVSDDSAPLNCKYRLIRFFSNRDPFVEDGKIEVEWVHDSYLSQGRILALGLQSEVKQNDPPASGYYGKMGY